MRRKIHHSGQHPEFQGAVACSAINGLVTSSAHRFGLISSHVAVSQREACLQTMRDQPVFGNVMGRLMRQAAPQKPSRRASETQGSVPLNSCLSTRADPAVSKPLHMLLLTTCILRQSAQHLLCFCGASLQQLKLSYAETDDVCLSLVPAVLKLRAELSKRQ